MSLSSLRRLVAPCISLALAVACGDDATEPPSPPAPPRLHVAITGPSMIVVGASATFTATVLDESNATVAGHTITWRSMDPAIASVSPTGVVTALASGLADIRASITGAEARRTLIVQENLAVASVGLFPREVTLAPDDRARLTAKVAAAGNVPLSKPVSYRSSAPAVATVEAGGIVVARGEGVAEIVAEAEGQSGRTTVRVRRLPDDDFTIDLRVIGDTTSLPMASIRRAVQRWERIISRGGAAQRVDAAAGSCRSWSPAIDETVQTIVVLLQSRPMDGKDGILGGTSVCVVREGTRLPVLATIELDSADMAMEIARGSFEATVAHELGHALGFGSHWFSTAAGPAVAEARPAENRYVYVGAAGVAAAYDWGTLLTPTSALVLERQGGAGTAGLHWSDLYVGAELMTAFADAGNKPLSIVTAASMRDLGYEIDEAGADWMFAPIRDGALTLVSPERRRPLAERLEPPRYTVDASGRLRPIR